MRKKQTSLVLVKDRFLTTKFYNVNQHKLALWLDDVMPEIDWSYGEYGIQAIDNMTKKKVVFCFGLYINKNDSTITIAELKSLHLKTKKDIVDGALVGKRIHKVMKVKNIKKEIWESADTFQKSIHQCLINYLTKSISDTNINS